MIELRRRRRHVDRLKTKRYKFYSSTNMDNLPGTTRFIEPRDVRMKCVKVKKISTVTARSKDTVIRYEQWSKWGREIREDNIPTLFLKIIIYPHVNCIKSNVSSFQFLQFEVPSHHFFGAISNTSISLRSTTVCCQCRDLSRQMYSDKLSGWVVNYLFFHQDIQRRVI